MSELLRLLKQGNKSAIIAACVNAIIAILKAVAYFITGNVAMFAEMLHSIGDAANQFFVFIGSALSKKAPTDRFPEGFGRLVNLVLLGAVLIVGIMSYETVKEGIHHIIHPAHSAGIVINLTVLIAAVILEAFVLFKAMKEVLHETGVEASGIQIATKSFGAYKKAKPATKLVFLEDFVATAGGVLAIVAILLSHYTMFAQAEGVASVMIGGMMFFVVGRVFLDNAAGVLGESDTEIRNKIGDMVIKDPDVKDIQEITVLKEGEHLHVELEVELDASITIAEADDIKDRLVEAISNERGVTDVIVEFDEDDGVQTWKENSLQTNDPKGK
ncbi:MULTISPECIES: cation diffusion facilitator family transporter [Bacillaceae]|uniref:Cation diffusion facilitator family transporter n=1 Tax=Peribacillus huizhouensis TaxID=1501239 RepID=A0ABR6CRP8_9BACI|nr:MULTISPECIES: cation diffusion facilitator family transporter [Bacillaceae]MBA9027027.1 cation diffusion facilitator family transporter [Peribacillus huizhouensis]